jgi:hypothetical protein
MAKDSKIQVKTLQKQASSFWLGQDFDVHFKTGLTVDYTKLAAAQRAIGNFVNIVTGKQIPVVFQSKESSYTDGERVVIGTKLEDKNFDPAVGLALHEGSHIAYTDFNLFKNLNGYQTSILSSTIFANHVRLRGVDPDLTMTDSEFSKIKDLLNWVEDRRIDYKIYTNAPGYRMYYEAMYDKYFNDKIIDKALQTNQKVKETWDCYLFHIINFTNPNRQLGALDKLQEIWNVIDLKNISRLETTIDALDVAIEVYRIISAAVDATESDDTQPKPSKQKSSSSSSGNSGDSGEPDENEEDSDDGESSGSDDDQDDSDDTTPLSQKELDKLDQAIQNQKQFLDGKQAKSGKLSSTQASLVNAMRESGTESRTVYTGKSGQTDPITTIVIKKLTPALICAMPDLFASSAADFINGKLTIDGNHYTGKKIKENEQAVTRGFILGKQLGSKLQLRNTDRSLKSTRLQAGKIDRRLVAQLGFDNANVFHRIVTDRFKNYFIHISIDASGSMSGTKFRQAITSTVAIAQAAAMTTGIRIQISLRGTSNLSSKQEKCVTVYVYDSAHDKLSKIRNIFKYLDTFGCTPEGLSFKSIENDIKADAKGDELIFINYSDGEPTDVAGVAQGYRGKDFTKNVVNNMRANNINVISYFISHHEYDSSMETFKYMYGQDAQFIRPDNITDVAKTINAKFLELAQ